MPNFVYHRVTVSGDMEQLKNFRTLMFCEDAETKELIFDFEQLIPMPVELKISAGSSGQIGFAALSGDWEKVAKYSWVPEWAKISRTQLCDFLKQHYPEYYKLGRAYQENLETHGFPTWNEWARYYWGTKWNARWLEIDRDLQSDGEPLMEFKFCTANSPPFPIFNHLADVYPGLVFRVCSFEDQQNYAAHGEFNGRNDYHLCDVDEILTGTPPTIDWL